MNYTQKSWTLAAIALLLITFTACDKGEETAEENLTTVEVHLTGTAGFDKKFYWNDTDGDGVANTIDTIVMPPNTGNVQAHLHVYDRSVSPELDITEEIEEENTEHLFTYLVTGANLTIGNLETDANGLPFGITSVWASSDASSGTLNIKLYHEPTDKNNALNPGGSVDLDITFPVLIRN